MNLSELKQKSSQEILELAESMGLDDISRKRKQDLIFSILKAHAKGGEEISGDGTLELLQDGYGFLRAEVNSYQANPDDIYVAPGLIRRCNLRRKKTNATSRSPKSTPSTTTNAARRGTKSPLKT